ncbi:MAG: succinate dehydrogenase/fumarate reductase iron-sulfur subunit [candidate division BRC1 bacterium ADurb.BinA364]|nr:MAG: succinate dehydrogenase/fumarate reductase iron-sulfur subunit [candidate division BRC1 bacterium ADurb.BinA364]
MTESAHTQPKPYALFLGCNIPVRVVNYEMSARKVAEGLGLNFVDIPDFSCCGYPLADEDRGETLLMSARNLALAEKAGCDVCALCSACTGALTEAAHYLKENEEVRAGINERLAEFGLQYNATVKVIHFARMLFEEIGEEALRAKITHPLNDLRIAPHYGCHYLKPSGIYGFDSVEDPKTLDRLIALTGATPIDYPSKLNCCGGGIMAVSEETALKVSRVKLEKVAAAGADAIGLVCPFCGFMYDTNQKKIESRFEQEYGIPVLFLTQILGLAMGFDPNDLGMKVNRVKPKELLAKIGA